MASLPDTQNALVANGFIHVIYPKGQADTKTHQITVVMLNCIIHCCIIAMAVMVITTQLHVVIANDYIVLIGLMVP